jgi:hypothetical protein
MANMDRQDFEFRDFLDLARRIEGTPDQIGTLESRFLKLVLSGFFSGWINRQLTTLGPMAENPGLWSLPQIEVERLADGLTISLRRYAAPQPLRSCHEAAILVPLGRNPLICEVYSLPPHDNAVFDPNITLTKVRSIAVAPGETFQTEPGHVYDIHATGGPAVAAVLACRQDAALTWSFDRASLKATGAGDANAVDQQLRAAIELMGILRDSSSLPLLQELAAHPRHTVRWSAIQSLGRISPAAARAQLEKALQDPHPHLRAAAAKTLQKIRDAT